VNSERLDPYKNFQFRVKLDDRTVAGFSKVSALTSGADTVEHRAGDELTTSRKSPDTTRFEAITLERGVTHDPEFLDWANMFNSIELRRNCGVPNDFRKDIVIEVLNEAGQLVLAYKLFGCWVSESQVLPELDNNANDVAIESIKLEIEGGGREFS
jgi:phage tail-like protein